MLLLLFPLLLLLLCPLLLRPLWLQLQTGPPMTQLLHRYYLLVSVQQSLDRGHPCTATRAPRSLQSISLRVLTS